MDNRPCDIVLEGGGVKGIGLIGAVEELYKAGHHRCRIAGTSAGAIVGSLLAADMPVPRLLELMKNLDYTKFRDEGILDKMGIAGKTASLVLEKGIYEGKYLRDWLAEQLESLGVRTFADLKLDDEPWAAALPPQQRYKLVVIVSDVSSGRLIRLPWDYKNYGLDPDTQLVADAVRASMSIPYFYEPVNLAGKYLVDGGLLSNFPIDIFDNTDDWPTFGIKLSSRADASATEMNPVTNPIDYSLAILSTAMNAHDQIHIDDPCTQQRTIFVDTFNIKATNFDITAEEQKRLYESGRHYAQKFLKTWDFEKYKQVCEKKD